MLGKFMVMHIDIETVSASIEISLNDNAIHQGERIIHALETNHSVEVCVENARALNIAFKAIEVAKDCLTTSETGLLIIPYLTEDEHENGSRSSMCFVIQKHSQIVLRQLKPRRRAKAAF
jgi:stage V sporulation protein SpoVS